MATSKEFQREQQGDVTDYKPTYTEGQPKQSESYKVYHDKTEASKSGVIHSQSDGQSRPLPVAEAVKEAELCEKGYAKKETDKQVGENRLPLNSHVEKTQKL